MSNKKEEEKKSLKELMENEKVEKVEVIGELKKSFISYAMAVNVSRAIPDVRDGLKPVHRRILFSMGELNNFYDKPHKKSARIVGEVMGKYHPHGDSSIYDALVRLAQDFSIRYPLVDGHGNFGSVDGDPPAAQRYTEARLSKIASLMLEDIDKETVDFYPNFDDTLMQPTVLPAKFPNLLVNGADGIAVGMATNIPPHNLKEVISGVQALIDNPDIDIDELIKIIPAPDYPTGGIIMGRTAVKHAYKTGRGGILVRGRAEIEETSSGRQRIVITELPYQVNKAKLLQTIVELSEEKTGVLSGIAEVRDESDRNGMRAVISVKKDGNVKAIIDNLLKSTDMKCSFAINMVAIANGKPKTMGLMEIISYYVEYQREIILRRSKYDLEVAKERSHILEGLLIAIKNIDEVVKIIKKAVSTADAKMKLKERFVLSERQAQAILDMRLARLTHLEVNKITDELKELKILIDKLTAIIKSTALQYQTVKEEILEIKRKYKNPRRTQILGKEEKVEIETVQVDVAVPMVLGLTAEGYLKCFESKTYSAAQKEFKNGGALSQVHTQILHVKSDTDILAFTSAGFCIRFNMSDLKPNKYRDKGTNPRDIFNDFAMDERIVALIPAEFNEKEERNLLFFTRQGMVKKTAFSEYNTVKSYIQAVKVKDDDVVINVEFDVDGHDMIFATAYGQVLFATKDDVPIQGRVSGGVRGVNFYEGDYCVYAGLTADEGEMVVVTEKAVAKRVILAQIDKLPRYRKGVRLILLNKEDKITFATCITNPRDLVLLTDEGTIGLNSEKIDIIPREKKGNPLPKIKQVSGGFTETK